MTAARGCERCAHDAVKRHNEWGWSLVCVWSASFCVNLEFTFRYRFSLFQRFANTQIQHYITSHPTPTTTTNHATHDQMNGKD